MKRPVGVVEVGDRIRFDGGTHVVAGLDGPRCRLVAEEGTGVQVLLLTQVLGAQDFAVLDASRPGRSRVPVHGPLDGLDAPVREKALTWERHILEVETGHIGSRRDWPPRPGYDPAVYGLAEREAAKAAELTAAGEQVSVATVRRMRARYREQGVWGLVDGRLKRERSAFGRADPRVVAAIKRALEEQQGQSTGTLSRLRRQVGWLLEDAHGPGVVAVPSVATFNRLVRSVAEQEQLALTAAGQRRRASRPVPVFTPTVATLPGELVMMDSTLLDVMVVCEDGQARPAAKSVTTAMIEVGSDLGIPELSELRLNTDSTQLRQQIGRRIGIGDTRSEPAAGSLAAPLSANLGHAVLLCLQNQDEVASKKILFHRQNDRDIANSLKATIPYFLGAVPEDQAALQQQLLQAKRAQRSAENRLKAAQEANQAVESQLQSLLGEARVHGLLADDSFSSADRDMVIEALRQASSFRPARPGADEEQRRQELLLSEQSAALRRQLRSLAEERQLLNDLESQAAGYSGAVTRGMSRLSALSLVPDGFPGEHSCPLCGNELTEPDPTVAAMHTTLEDLRGQLDSVRAVQPRREQALREIEQVSARLREELRGIEGALSVIAEQRSEQAGLLGQAEAQAYTRGRISAYLSQISTTTDNGHLQRLQADAAMAQQLVQGLEEQLDNDAVDEKLTHSLGYVSGKMTSHARFLNLEHGGGLVRLNLKKPTVVTDAPAGSTELLRIGSGKNHVGYHLAAHLALHQYFTANSRPVPRFLMLDQPTQPYYPSDMAKARGRLEDLALDEDRETVTRLFQLMHQVVAELAPDFQIIVSDHADLPHTWYQASVRYNWRNGEKLIPTTWLDTNPTP